MSKSKILLKLGLNELDLEHSMRLFAEVDPSTRRVGRCCNQAKIEKILGYSINRMKRSKALRLMGVTEEDIDLENSKNLASLGTGGRKRSFIAVSRNETLSSTDEKWNKPNRRRVSIDILIENRRRSSLLLSKTLKRRKSSSDVRTLKRAMEQMHASLQKHATSTHLEVIKLRERVRSLEEEIKVMGKGMSSTSTDEA